MPESKKSKYARKKKVVYDRVRFTLPDLFDEEAVFNLPSARQVPLGVQRKLNSEPGVMENWLLENVSGDDVEDQIAAFDTLSGEEVKEFMRAWQKASKADAGKSSR
ncbi:hypothetical protein [Brachybacterium squillarum]|uniref:hypothetical protein n=1 Tax=Brachybacterium squillarum TaxID=661979 RepID=UPI0022219318|nr:hypothetical protein [Brachybacterium squillarum]MCW1803876.1 hypothetical protein [Brachybacterium squillarum]